METAIRRTIFVLASAILGIVFGVGFLGFMQPEYRRIALDLPAQESPPPVDWGEPCQTAGTLWCKDYRATYEIGKDGENK